MSLVADNDGRESLIKMLLTSPILPIQTTTTPNLTLEGEFTGFPSPTSESASDELIPSITNYVQSLANFTFEEPEIINKIAMEHSYSRAWNWKPESSSLKPARCIMVHKPPLCPGCHNDIDESYIDIDGPASPPPPLPYDVDKGRLSMNEIETQLVNHQTKHDDTDWEAKIDRTHWSVNENTYYSLVKNILHEDLVGRLTIEQHRNEPVLRRAIIDRSVSKFRQAFNSIGWDIKILQWMHNLLIDNLNKKLLTVYLDILQGLKDKLPTLTDAIMFSGVLRLGSTSYESLFELVKKPWDPLGDNVINNKIKKIPNNPIIFVCPSCPQSSNLIPSRYHQLMTFLNAMATVEIVSMNLGFSLSRLTLTQIVEHMLASSRTRLQEVKTENPDRPIILLGFHSGASLAFQIAQTEIVTCIVCIGFDLHTTEGKRGLPDDIILDIPYPVLFVSGENSARSHPEELENLREKMCAETSLIIIGSADDSLRLNYDKKVLEGVTQSMVDRCIMDEIADYVTTILLNPFPALKKRGPTYISTNSSLLKIKHKQVRSRKLTKRRASNSSLGEIEKKSPSPAKRPRPVGRPRGSGKNKTNSIPQLCNTTNTTLHSINNPPPGGITVTVGCLRSPSKIQKLDNCVYNAANEMTTINLTPQNNLLKTIDENPEDDLDDTTLEEVINRAVSSILPDSPAISPAPSPAPKKTSCIAKKVLITNNKRPERNFNNTIRHSQTITHLLKGSLYIPKGNNSSIPSTETNKLYPSHIDISKCKLLPCVDSAGSSSVMVSTNNINSIQRQNNTKLVKIIGDKTLLSNQTSEQCVNRPVLLTAQNRNQRKPGTPSVNDQFVGTNILDIPIIFADNDGNINDTLKMDGNHLNLTSQSSSKSNKSPVKMVIVNQQSPNNTGSTQLELKNIHRQFNNCNQKVLTNNFNSRYPKILVRRSSIQSSPKFNNKPQLTSSPTIDFKDIDLECELVANKVLKTIPPIVKQTSPSSNSEKNNRDTVCKSTLHQDVQKKIIRSPIIIKPGAHVKSIPMIKAQNILNKSFTLKKNSVGNFVTGQKITVQNKNSKDHSDA